MIKKFLLLEWKAFSRSASFEMHLVLKILLGIAAVFYSCLILLLGIGAFYGLTKNGVDPLLTINHYLIYWWAFDLVVRYFLQKSPVMNVRPFLTLPLKKTRIVSFLLGKSALSFFNLYPSFFFIPFSIVLLLNGYSVPGVIAWHIAAMSLVYGNNYLNLLINNKNALLLSLAGVMLTLGGLQYYHVLDITIYTAPLFQGFYDHPYAGICMILIPFAFYYLNFRSFKNSLKLDDLIQSEQKEIRAEHYGWLDQYGVLGTFLKNDIRLIKRNKRPKTTVWTSILFLFYGLIFFSNSSYDSPLWHLFAGLFITGGFLFTFGGFVPSWDSAYYSLMMSQNIQYKEYLASKWWLILFATLASMLLASFYLAFGWQVYLTILAGGIYNIGVNAYFVLLGGAYVKTPIDLGSGKKIFGDKKAFNVQTLLVSLPKLVLPLLFFFVFYKLFNVAAGYIAVALLGLIGLAFINKVFNWIEKVYKQEKYATLAAYKQIK
jgi:hypothetical protein